MQRLIRDTLSFLRLMVALVFSAALATSCSERKRAADRRRALTNRDFALEAVRLKNKLGRDFIVEVERPFIIAGNVSRPDFNRIKNRTIVSSYQAFYRQFFRVRPNYIITVFLFKDDPTYREYAKKLFGDEPTTPFGYYKRENHSLVMNIATGTGTLVHEMTHALVEADFPQIPAWHPVRNAFAPQILKWLATTSISPSLKCWAISALVTTLSKRLLTGRGNSLPSGWGFRLSACG